MNAKLKNILKPSVLDHPYIQLALTHRSHCSDINNERLEFLGDSALGLVVSEWLYEQKPDWTEGGLSRVRSTLVSKEALHTVGESFGISDSIIVAPSIDRPISARIVSGTVEAIIGAVYLTGTWEETREFVLHLLEPLLADIPENSLKAKDNKTALQEILQSMKKEMPVYSVVSGMDRKTNGLVVTCSAANKTSVGIGATRKQAEQQAAGRLLKKLR